MIEFHRPVAFWLGTTAITAGVLMHLPDFLSMGDMGYRMVGMPMSSMMIAGMWLIVAGMVLATWGLLPPRHLPRANLSGYHVRAHR